MLYVGLTENHKESATMFADVVGAQVILKLMAFNSTGADNKSGQCCLSTLILSFSGL